MSHPFAGLQNGGEEHENNDMQTNEWIVRRRRSPYQFALPTQVNQQAKTARSRVCQAGDIWDVKEPTDAVIWDA
jgi:hypothetical protein